jgi:hypothetical protein
MPMTSEQMMTRFTISAVLVAAALLIGSGAQAAGEAVVPGQLTTRATFEHIGVVWQVDGDTDLDSILTIEFREQGTSSWLPGAPAVRAYPSLIVNGAPLDLDQWGASAMWLAPGTTYEIRATLTDPDGGSETRIVAASTRRRPTAGAITHYVVPGTGGGNGTISDPYRGLQAAADAAQPGNTFDVAPGTYAPFELTASGTDGAPIAFVGQAGAIVDGAGTDRGVVTLGVFDETLTHVIVQGLTIQNGAWGVDAQNTQDIVIANNTITDVGYGVVNRRANAWESNQTVCDNLIIGRTPWPGSGIPGERGIDLRGDGNVVCFNSVQNFGDCVSLQPSTGPSAGNDVYGNDAASCVDDGIEIDYNQANVRVWRNRVTNARMGVSVQPIYGGPAYIFRNEFFNLESVPVKMHNDTTGFLVVHNSGAKVGDAYGDNGAMWRNATLRNNVFLGTRYAFEFTTVRDEGFRDFDFNAWGSSGATPWFKWENVRYDHIGDLPAGVEDNGVEIGFADLANAALPTDWDVAVTPGSRDLRATGTQLADLGESLPNLNDPFVVDGMPDLGAFEGGQPVPGYGPGAAVTGPFTDVAATHLFADEIAWLAAQGITAGCNPPFGDRFCPNDSVTRAQMASFLVRALDLPASSDNRFSDDNGSTHEDNINALAAAGVTLGCGDDLFCPNDAVTRAQMASFIVRALGLTAGAGADLFTDDDGTTHEDNIDRLATAGITLGCDAGLYCPNDPVIRAHMAAFLYRALAD